MEPDDINTELLAKVINYRALFRKMAKMKNIDVYDKSGRCRFCNAICKVRKLEHHNHPCPYVVGHLVPKSNKDLRSLMLVKKDQAKPTWFERMILWMFNPSLTNDKRSTFTFKQRFG